MLTQGDTLHGWIYKYGSKLNATATVEASAHDELKRLRKENARLKQERDILYPKGTGKKPRRTLREKLCKVRLDKGKSS